MIVAFANGIFGMALCLSIGMGFLGLSLVEALGAVVASNIAGLISLLSTLRVERVAWIRENLLRSSLRTWIMHSFFYFGLLVLLSPPLRNLKNLFGLSVPLILSTGFAICVFGPIQDRIVRRRQRTATSPPREKRKELRHGHQLS